MKMKHFYYMLEIDRFQSILAAARSLHLGQSTLSAIVKTVENELGFQIFLRTPHGVTTTPAGRHFISLAWEIRAKYEELLRFSRQQDPGAAQAVRALLCPSIMTCLPIPLSRQFYALENYGNLTFEECPSSTVGARLIQNEASIGVAYLTDELISHLEETAGRENIEVERVLTDQLHLLLPRGHRLAGMESVDVREVCSERVATAKRIRNDEVLGKLMTRCERITMFSSIDIMKRAIQEQGMVGFLPRYPLLASQSPDAENLSIVPIRNTERTNRLFVCLIHRREQDLRYHEKFLISCIREHFQAFGKGEGEGRKVHESRASALHDRD